MGNNDCFEFDFKHFNDIPSKDLHQFYMGLKYTNFFNQEENRMVRVDLNSMGVGEMYLDDWSRTEISTLVVDYGHSILLHGC